ncbi:response regulator [Amorphus sp. 3PC139-8]|uniref:hybrid sensor histidine kinase/response regulator n=1 Tax=Amorphus sp. 3PC139-8 TaxID=2735676 RepID=UPI00345DC9BF
MDERKRRLRERLLVTFKDEAADHLQTLRTLLETGSGEQGWLERSFRTVHTLKGAARSVGLDEIETTCSQLENRLSQARAAGQSATPDLEAQVRTTITQIERQLARLAEPEASHPDVPHAQPAARPPRVAPEETRPPERFQEEGESGSAGKSERSGGTGEPMTAVRQDASHAAGAPLVRVPADDLDKLLAATEELLPLTAEMPRFAAELQERRGEITRIRRTIRQWDDGGGTSVKSDLETRLREIERVVSELSRSILSQSRTLTQTYNTIVAQGRQIRLVPVWTVFGGLAGTAEDLAATQSKEIAVTTKGFDIAVDRRILEALKDPLLHAIGNAIDHGIETPQERRSLGKPVPASVSLSVRSLDDGRVEFCLRDDGRGFDLEKLKQAAIRLRIADPSTINGLAESEQVELAFRSGLSTSAMVTQVSGHGLGLAILRDRVEDLKGTVQVHSVTGGGVTLTLAVPASIAVFRVFQVRVGARTFAIPVESVVGAARVSADAVVETASGPSASLHGEAVQLLDLASLLGVEKPADEEERAHRQVVVVSVLDRRLGLFVDDIEGEVEVLFKPFQPPLVRVRHVSGIGVSGTGVMLPILRISDVVRGWSTGALRPGPAGKQERRQQVALVVDDSMTTRVMEQHLLEAAGYAVILAEDGVEALEALRSRTIDFVVSDIDMPRMDGFELTRKIREDERLADLPVVLLTALENRQDKLKGMEAGANSYMTKSDFDQTRLLDILARLL